MRKIAFFLQTMVLGGVEKELITIFKQIHNLFDITLVLLYLEDKEILNEIPDDIKIYIVNIDKKFYCGNLSTLVKQRIKKGNFSEAISITTKRLFKIGMPASNTNIADLKNFDDEFDVAICYHIHSPLMLKYVTEKVCAKKKIGWIHNDFYTTKYPIQQLRKYVMLYDEFVAVSKKVENEFRQLCPWYCGSIDTAYNYLNVKEIIALSNEPINDAVYMKDTDIKILTIGRFTEQKGIDSAIIVASMLKKENFKFHWFLIGYGCLEASYRRLIETYDVSDCFTILGKKTNPYPYIRNCEIYVQPSRHEAFPLTVMEAKILQRAIVCTNYDGADEQINNNVNGIIVPLNNINALFEAVAELILFPEKRISLVENLKESNHTDALNEIIKHFL